MWVRMTQSELTQSAIKKKKVRFMALSETKTGMTIFLMVIMPIFLTALRLIANLMMGEEHTGSRFSPGGWDKIDTSEAFNNIPSNFLHHFFVCAILTVILVYILNSTKNFNPYNYVCDKCNKFEQKHKKKKCECGGEFVDIEKMKWINNIN